MQKDKNKQQPPKDPSLDTPSEANTAKHINFREQEEKALNTRDDESDDRDQQDEQRRKEWKKGIEEGKKEQYGK